MTRAAFVLLSLAVMLGAGVAGYYLQSAGTSPSSPTVTGGGNKPTGENVVGTPRPVFSLPDLDGEVHSVSDWDGDVLAINFWATWCTPCKEEIPEFVELQEKYRDRGVTFIGVAIDRSEPVSAFAERYRMNYPVLIGEQAAIEASRAYGNQIGALPYTAFVDRSGRIAHVHRGRLQKPEAEAVLRDLTGPSG